MKFLCYNVAGDDMNKLKFSKKRSKYCINCIHGKHLEYTDEVFCTKKGFVDKFNKCHRYKYDPLKRMPDKNISQETYNKEDFSL